ncbi:ParB/RepB/Spo0J family partition protein [Corynebacterium liangguodongii]|uniref:Cell division protein n=1 Tax=Corynebacterium liangguodongii TaxID=2079535 RepID=A0A2S0WGP0_9CORY|nr:ParB/RepB/Spo0J family partition protein [Corynebacterium liangguodongii]AWB84958.1 cell division protein [Corynebacterium liangguodongii]PWB99334.1 ParB/RepB/Spo0J family partition protein [Corynebacterium liangguodongii]
MAAERKGGLGRGLAALIPSNPESTDSTGKTGRLGAGATDVIIGGTPGAARAAKESAKGEGRRVQGAPTIPGAPTVTAQREGVRQAIPVGARYQEVPIGAIVPNPKQPRQVFDEDELAELVHSIKEFGLLQPIVVRETEQGFELIMGERRWRAASKAGLKHIPAIVRETNDADMLRDALLENIHRVQLNPLEEAAAYQQLLQEFGVTQEELADRLGRSRPKITNSIRLLNLPVGVQRRVAAGVLSAGHARALLGVKVGAQQQEKLADRVVAEGLSVRATEEAVTLLNRLGDQPEKPKRTPVPQPEYLSRAAERLADEWDTKVEVTMGKRKGKIVVEFGDRDDLERILSLIQGDEA